jgi:LacI family transcriptional regulator
MGAQELGYERRVKLQIYNARGRIEADRDALRALAGAGADGALIASLQQPELIGEIRSLHQCGFPFVLIDERVDDLGISTVTFDNWSAGHLAAEQLLAAGHVRIGFIGFIDGDYIRQRLDGVRDAVNDAGLAFDRSLVLGLPRRELLSDEAGDWLDRLRALLDRPDRPTALVLHNSLLAAGLAAVCREMGMAIPRDLSVVSMGDEQQTDLLVPRFSSVGFPSALAGRTAMELLLARIDDPGSAATHRLMPVGWNPGLTVAPPSDA